jgi:hypothetical protein
VNGEPYKIVETHDLLMKSKRRIGVTMVGIENGKKIGDFVPNPRKGCCCCHRVGRR